MLRRMLTVPLLMTASLAFADDKRDVKLPGDVYAANKKLGRGINIGNALEAPKEGDWGVTLKAEYFQEIKKAGFDSVRLPINWAAHAGREAPYTIDPTFAERIDWAVDQAVVNRLNIVVNVHHYGGIDADPDKHLPRLVALWEQIADRYKDRPPSIYFELLNEPHGKLIEGKWNAAVAMLLRAVRKTNPTRPVIVGPAQWNAIWALDKLELPKDDRHVILTVHCYDPYEFTHQGAPWSKGADKWKGRKWTGSDAEKEAIRKQFTKASAWAKEHDRPVFLGEFGAYEVADMESRARWTAFVAGEAEKLGFSWAYWEFGAGFGAYDRKAGKWREQLRSALVK
jgi:endoglucanase